MMDITTTCCEMSQLHVSLSRMALIIRKDVHSSHVRP